MVMKYLSEGDLHHQNDQERFTYQEAAIVLYQGLLALQFLHDRHVIHHNIRPSNILCDTRVPLHVRLTDFGVFKLQPAIDYAGSPFTYQAPECFFEERRTWAVDIWSLAVVILQILCNMELPTPVRGANYGSRWCANLVEFAKWRHRTCIMRVGAARERPEEDWQVRLLDFLLGSMLILDHRRRETPTSCLERGMATIFDCESLSNRFLPSLFTQNRDMCTIPNPRHS